MAVEVLPLTDADLREYTRIHFAAFTTGLGQFFGGPSEARDNSFMDSEGKAMHEDPTVIYLKAVDKETGAIIGCAKYHKYDKARSEEETKVLYAPRPAPPAANAEAWNDFMSWLAEVRVKYLTGKPCWVLSVLVVDPAYHRCGAGSALIKWGCERADKDNLDMHLEASPMGFPLYLRFGYETLERREFDTSKYGGSGIESNTVMVRRAKAATLKGGSCGIPEVVANLTSVPQSV